MTTPIRRSDANQGWHRPEGEPLWVRLFPSGGYLACWDRLLTVGIAGEYVVMPIDIDPNVNKKPRWRM